MILSSLFLATLAAASAVFAVPASNNNREVRDVSRWSIKDSLAVPRAVPQIIDTGLSQLKKARRETNAERMARGLPPMKPRKLFESGTKAAAALKPRTSATPKKTILLYDVNGRSGGNLLGYWSAQFKLNAGDYTGCYYLTTTCSDSITNPTWSSDYYLRNPAAPGVPDNAYPIGYPEIGAVTQSDKDASWDTSTGNYNNAFIAGVAGTGPNAPPEVTLYHSYQEGNIRNWGTGDYLQSESNIWDCTGADGECFPFWINPAGVRKSAQLVYIPGKYSVLSITSDINKMLLEGAYYSTTLVRMYIVDNYVCPN